MVRGSETVAIPMPAFAPGAGSSRPVALQFNFTVSEDPPELLGLIQTGKGKGKETQSGVPRTSCNNKQLCCPGRGSDAVLFFFDY